MNPCTHTQTHPQKRTTNAHKQVEAGERGWGGGKHQISGELSKRKDQNVVRRRSRAVQSEAAGNGAVVLEIESINFKLM